MHLRRRPRSFVARGLAGFLVFALLALLLIRLGPAWLADTEGLNAVQSDEARGRVRTALFALAAGVIALVGAIYTARTFELNQRGQITERFTRAVDQLGSDRIEIRLGGIYALERIAHESPDERGPIIRLLAAYARERSPWPPRGFRDEDGAIVDETGVDLRHPQYVPPEAALDVKAVAAVLARWPESPRRGITGRLDLSRTNLSKVSALGIDLRDALLDNAQLYGADLHGAKLQAARLRSASLRRVGLLGADLREARLDAADLQRAHLQGANLDGANLAGTDFRGAWDSEATVWPPGFDRSRAGVQRQEST